MRMQDGEWVRAEERFFAVRAGTDPLSRDGWTENVSGQVSPVSSRNSRIAASAKLSPGSTPPPGVAQYRFVMRMQDGEWVRAEERFFAVRAGTDPLSRDGWVIGQDVLGVDLHRRRRELGPRPPAVLGQDLDLVCGRRPG
jgi:8-oxo-dGTP diphosphatase